MKHDNDMPWYPEDELLEHTPYDTEAPIHSFRALKEAVEAGEVPRPDVIPLLTLNSEGEIRSPIIKGWLHLYTGAPKVGKTELLFQAILNWVDERRTLWLSEEGLSVWVEKTHRTPWSIVKGDFHFAYARDKNADWMLHTIEAMDDNGGIDVVVVDTIKLLGIEEENNPAQISRAFQPFANLCAKRGITVILVHHNRKAGGRFGDEVSGSNSFTGSVDVIISIRRHSDNDDDTRRICEVHGRADNMRFVYVLDKETGEMRIAGELDSYNMLGLKKRIEDVITVDPLTASQLRDIIVLDGKGEVSKSSVGKLLFSMATDGEIVRLPDISEGKIPRQTPRWAKL